jgi:hypothetical protein
MAGIRSRCGVAEATQRSFTVSSRAEEAHMHPYFFSLLYRERVAQYERDAEYRRHFPKQKSHRLKRFVSLFTRLRRRTRTVAPVAAEARPCH